MRLGDIIAILDRIAPFDLAEAWDNCGIQTGDPDQEIKSLILGLDPTFALIEHAIQTKADLIITHHPLFFQPVKHINFQETLGAKAAALIRHSIALVSLHTNLDSATGGVADTLAMSLGLQDIKMCAMLRTGKIAPVNLEDWVRTLPFQNPRFCKGSGTVRHIAVCPGSGMDLWQKALSLGCDTFLTGDVKYHAALDAVEAGLNIIDAGHCGSERLVLKPLLERLRAELPPVNCAVFEEHDVFYHTINQGELL